MGLSGWGVAPEDQRHAVEVWPRYDARLVGLLSDQANSKASVMADGRRNPALVKHAGVFFLTAYLQFVLQNGLADQVQGLLIAIL